MLPAYAGLISSVGLGFLMETAYLLPLTALFLTLALVSLGLRARRRRGYGPLILGLTAAAVLLVGKFALDSDAAVWAGLAALIAASVWNAWPVPPAVRTPLAPEGVRYQLGSINKET
jgi:hypothetical protein